MTLNDFMFIFGLGITFTLILLSCVVVILVRNEEAREVLKQKTSHRKLKHQKHVLKNA